MRKPGIEIEWKKHMSEEQAKEFDALFLAYWSYIYKYELNDLGSWNPDSKWYARNDFKEQIQEEAMIIKVKEGY